MFYRPVDDIVRVLPICNFSKTEEYYSTLFHEHVHSTGHDSLQGLKNLLPLEMKTTAKRN
ncbi:MULTISPECIES: zincin-like metallopeptidase domain-containing protein [Paenibacillus]|uniref:zincin-like metallopeptidase domain-containing protein n=1 Tax=Paenibacillus TaxID=44249 RepID=UPI0037C79DA4